MVFWLKDHFPEHTAFGCFLCGCVGVLFVILVLVTMLIKEINSNCYSVSIVS